jgi:predicted glycosyltransferase
MAAAMIYVQHLLGIGHLMRSRQVAEALAGAGFEVHLVSGGEPARGRPPRAVRTVQLPPIHVADGTLDPLLGPTGHPVDEAFRRERRDALLAAFDAAAPSVVLVETFPFGRRALRFELVPLMERIASMRARPLVVASVRDILQLQRKPERAREMLDSANRWFDAVLVHGDPRFVRFEATFPLAPELQPPVHYTGFVAAPMEPHTPSRTRMEVVISAGGGTVGMDLLTAALAAQRKSRFGHLQWRVLVGSTIPNEAFERLRQGAAPGAIVERARDDFAALLSHALISVSRAGYNTVLDVVRSGARPVLVPYAEAGETEQRMRANRLRELDLALVVDSGAVQPAELATAIDAALAREHWGAWDFDCNGAQRSAALVKALVEAGTGTQAARSP